MIISYLSKEVARTNARLTVSSATNSWMHEKPTFPETVWCPNTLLDAVLAAASEVWILIGADEGGDRGNSGDLNNDGAQLMIEWQVDLTSDEPH